MAQRAAAHGFSLARIGGDAAIIVGGALTSNAFNYLYHFIISRRLGPDGYGTLATLAAAATILAVFGGTIGIVAMQDTARLWATNRSEHVGPFVRAVAPAALLAALVIAAISFVAGVLAGPYLHIVRLSLWGAFGAYLALTIFSGFFRGAAQGAHRFGLFAASTIGETACKLVSALVLVAAGFAVLGALGGFVIGALVGLCIVALPLAAPRGDAATTAQHDHLELGGRALSVLWISACVLMLLFMDQLFAKHHLDGADAGYYGAAGTIARTIPFGVGMISLVMAPKAAAALHVSRDLLRRLLALTFGAGAALALAGFAIAALVPAQLLSITYGPSFAQAQYLLREYAGAEALLAVDSLGIAYLQAIGSYRITIALITAVVVEALLMAAFGTSGPRIIGIAGLVNFALVPVVAAYVAVTLRGAPQAGGPPPDEALLLDEPRLL
ncbi:MAG: oligosaccharide flippase family protein [Candidatus Eremiobacteraeota bacterium]|nr:oligosaccharide flippase family protein [Candidatus Eremiobacteraeota bacterium]MBV8365013.1 oligosaccharide flippase family protein [Candidatus Eremiobacteraeota bacterium]